VNEAYISSLSPPTVNVVNIGGDYEIGQWSFCVSVVLCVYTMTQEQWRPPVNTSTFYSSNV